jgi:uridine kinase
MPELELVAPDLNALIARLHLVQPKCGSVRVITIDGPAGSGKTTLAQSLCEMLEDCPVVHMDDLYSGWQQDLKNELADRILQSILKPIELNLEAKYLKYNWLKSQFDQTVIVPQSRYLILEGVGAGNPKLHAKTALNIWIEADPSQLLNRLVTRDGEEMRAELNAWQSHEAEYFQSLSVRDLADVRLSGD